MMYFGFFMSQLWTMILIALTKFWYISNRVCCTVKVNIKETLWESMVSCTFLCGEWTAGRKQKTYT